MPHTGPAHRSALHGLQQPAVCLPCKQPSVPCRVSMPAGRPTKRTTAQRSPVLRQACWAGAPFCGRCSSVSAAACLARWPRQRSSGHGRRGEGGPLQGGERGAGERPGRGDSCQRRMRWAGQMCSAAQIGPLKRERRHSHPSLPSPKNKQQAHKICIRRVLSRSERHREQPCCVTNQAEYSQRRNQVGALRACPHAERQQNGKKCEMEAQRCA